MLESRRKAVRILRKIQKETEKMTGRLLRGGQGERVGGLEVVWDTWAEETERGSITAAECAEYLLNAEEGDGKKVEVRRNTLPAYAAHALMMGRPDMFVADTGDMWESGVFMVRSRVERTRLQTVEGWYDGSIPGSQAIVDEFGKKAREAIAFSNSMDQSGDITHRAHTLPDWTFQELEIIAILLTRVYEVRSTQVSPTVSLSYSIMKSINAYEGLPVDQDLVQRFLSDIGMLSSYDSLARSRTVEGNNRQMAMQGDTLGGPVGSSDLLRGTELDDLREDFTHHRVFVIDDATASELDDGIAIEKVAGTTDTWVHIHVADPTRYLHPNHDISTAASFQGSSVYTFEGNRPLLPLEIIMKELSLGADVERQGVMTISALLGENGELKDEKVRMGWIKQPRVVTYAAVNEALGLSAGDSTRPLGALASIHPKLGRTTSDPTSEDIAELRHLHDLAIKHRKRRYTTSGFEWSTAHPSLRIVSQLPPIPSNVFDPLTLPRSSMFHSGQPLIDYTVSTSPPSSTLTSQSIVAECMILAGKVAASFCHRNKIPAPYRGTSAPQAISAPTSSRSSSLLDTLLSKRDQSGGIDPYEIMKSNLYLPPGQVSPTIVPHWVMGLTQPDTGYLRATSPLRRFDDMLVHWQIKSHLASRKGISIPWSTFNPAEIEMLVKRNEIGQKSMKRAQLNSSDWWIARFIKDRLHGPLPEGYTATREMIDIRGPLEGRVTGTAGTAVVDGRVAFPIRIEALAVSAQLYVPKSKEIPIGETVHVRIDQVELALSLIRTSLAE
jgi:hypothetical protein